MKLCIKVFLSQECILKMSQIPISLAIVSFIKTQTHE